jgi:hypothetical protein
MKLSTAARILAIGFTVAVMTVAVGSGTGYAYAHKAKAKSVAATAPQYAPEHQVRLRYYGGPKSPMYP